MGVLTVQEKAPEKLKTSQMSPCWPHLISEPHFQPCTSVRSTTFMFPLLGWSPPFFQETSFPPSRSHLRDHPFMFGFSIEGTAFPHPSSTRIFHSKPCRRVGGGSEKQRLLWSPCQCELQASCFSSFSFCLFPEGQKLILRACMVSILEEEAKYFVQHP